jgi:hypothetical protein
VWPRFGTTLSTFFVSPAISRYEKSRSNLQCQMSAKFCADSANRNDCANPLSAAMNRRSRCGSGAAGQDQRSVSRRGNAVYLYHGINNVVHSVLFGRFLDWAACIRARDCSMDTSSSRRIPILSRRLSKVSSRSFGSLAIYLCHGIRVMEGRLVSLKKQHSTARGSQLALGSSQKMCLTRFLSSVEDDCNACCLISPQRPIRAPQLAQWTALSSASLGSTTSARRPHVTQRRSNGTGNESIQGVRLSNSNPSCACRRLTSIFWLFPWPRLSLVKGDCPKPYKGRLFISRAATKRNFLFNVRQRTCRGDWVADEQNTKGLNCLPWKAASE